MSPQRRIIGHKRRRVPMETELASGRTLEPQESWEP